MNLKKIGEYYKAPTPIFWRKVGDSILTLGTLFTGGQIMSGNQNAALIGLLLTWFGKTITNLATE